MHNTSKPNVIHIHPYFTHLHRHAYMHRHTHIYAHARSHIHTRKNIYIHRQQTHTHTCARASLHLFIPIIISNYVEGVVVKE